MRRNAEPDGLATDDFLAGGGGMAALIRAKDWSATPLGPIEGWPQSLRTTVSLCLASNFPINIIWGPDHSQIYNDGYRVVCGDAHPRALGEDYSVTWASAWPAIGEPFNAALGGATSFLENQRMFLTRNGYLEETFFTFSTSPIRDESGGIGGLFHPVTETTATMLAERRTRAVRDLTAALGIADDIEALATAVIATLSGFAFDLPFLLLYAHDEEIGDYRLAGHYGIDAGTPVTPLRIDPESTAPWPVAQAIGTAEAVQITGIAPMFAGLRCGPYEEAPDAAFVIPVNALGAGLPPLILIAAVSPRLPFGDAYRGFHELLTAALSAALASVRARADERRRVEALAAIDRAKTAFFSNVSHEFRTPLTLMLGPIEDALEDADTLPDMQRERLDVAHRNALRLLKLVNALLDFSRIEAGRVQAQYEPTDLGSVTVELASNFRSACERAGIMLDVHCPPLSRPVPVDRDMWEKIVLNLLSNAFKFTLEGGITVTLREAGDQVELVVRDTGVGIAAAELPRLFERFHRIEGQRGRTHAGTGIGLALVQELVTLHGGTIEAESREGAGTAFRVLLPFQSPHPYADRQAGPLPTTASTATRAGTFVEEALRWLPEGNSTQPPAIHEPDATPATNPAPTGERPRILLADDNADMRAYIRRILEDGGYVVEAVPNGLAALTAARRLPPPDLVLTDVMMPELDGFGLLRAVRDDPALEGLVVILLSARAGEEARIEGLSLGADDYLVKPFGTRELKARVDGAIRLARQRREAAAREAELQTAIAVQREQAGLQQTERRLEYALEAGRLGSWELDLEGWALEASATCKRIYGFAPDAAFTYDDVLGCIDPRDRHHQHDEVMRAVATGANLDVEYRITRPDGSQGWVQVRGKAEYDGQGHAVRMAGISLDITARKRADERQKLLLDELNHRVKNTLATVQSISMQTRRTAGSPEAFARNLDARIEALAGAHDLLIRTTWDGADLADILALTLAPYAEDSSADHRIEYGGPPIRLGPNAAVTLSMAFHELATNAAKYGAFSTGDGLVRVDWSVDHHESPPVITIRWAESDGPAVQPPGRRGFGSRLLEQGLARELNGTVTLDYRPEGLVCQMRFPASAKIEVIGTDGAVKP